MAVPDEIKKHRLTGLDHATEIKQINGSFYVYEITSVWNDKKRRPQKKTLGCIGKITASDGFIGNQRYVDLYHHRTPFSRVWNYGAVEMFRQLGQDIRERLREHFPDIWRQLEVICLLRLVYASTGETMKYDFDHSWLWNLYPDIGVCCDSVRNIMDKMRMRLDDEQAFMRSFYIPGTELIFDGTVVFCYTSDSYACKGYNSMHLRHTQVRLVYVFDKDSKQPIFFRVIPGRALSTRSQ